MKINRRSKENKQPAKNRIRKNKKPIDLPAILLFNPNANIKVSLTKKGRKAANEMLKKTTEKPTVILHHNQNFQSPSPNESNIDLRPMPTTEFIKLLTTTSSVATTSSTNTMHNCCYRCTANRIVLDKSTNTELLGAIELTETTIPKVSKAVSIFTKTNIPQDLDHVEQKGEEEEDIAHPDEIISSEETLNKWKEFNKTSKTD